MTPSQKLILGRRSHYVKEFTGEIVPDDVIERMLANAQSAPNHKATKPWRFHVFKGEALHKLCLAMEDFYLKNTEAEKFSQQKLDKIRTYKEKISHIISIGMHPSGMVPEWEELAATAAAVQNMWLTLGDEKHAAGYWSSGNGTGTEFMRDFTGLESGDKQLGFFFLGWVSEKRFYL